MLKLNMIGRKAVKILTPNNDNQKEISFFDVKELYDAAFAEKDRIGGNLKRFARLLAQAQALEARYRAQSALAEIDAFEKKWGTG